MSLVAVAPEPCDPVIKGRVRGADNRHMGHPADDVVTALAARSAAHQSGGPRERSLAAAARSVAVTLGAAMAAVLATLVRPLPEHVADYRRQARGAVVLAALVIVVATIGTVPAAAVADRSVMLALGAGALAFGAACGIAACERLLNRFDGLVALVLIAGLVAATDGEQSIYRPLFLLLLLYAALLYDGARLLATGVLLAAVSLGPVLAGGMAAASLAVLLVEVPVWALIAGIVHTLVQRTRSMAQTDGLTGLRNHVTFWTMLHAEHGRMVRYGSHYSVLLIDLDHFKQLNDTHGHRIGDEVLRGIGALLRRCARSTDVVARYGGEEFALLLTETTRDEAITVAERIRAELRATALRVAVTVSIGVAASRDGFAASPEEIVNAADAALYRAKRAGRDHVAVALPESGALAYLSGTRRPPVSPR